MSTALVWFRRDLRLADHPALRQAAARHQRIIPVYLHAPHEEAPWSPGAASRWWLHHSLAAQSEPFDPDGAYLRQWLPELAKLSTSAIQQPWTLAQAESMAINAGLSRDYPRPVVDLAASRVEALAGYARLKAD